MDDNRLVPDEPAWMPDSTAMDEAAKAYDDVLSNIDIQELAVGIPHGADVAIHEGEGYADALIDLSRLLEEVRFGASVGMLYATGVRIQLLEVQAKMQTYPHNLGFSNKARAMLTGYIAEGAPPLHLLTNPSQKIAGSRVLGGWWAAQLYDSAMMRGVAALDRLTTLLFHVEGLPVNSEWTPSFSKGSLEKLSIWRAETEWTKLIELLDDELFRFARRYRHGLVHRTRYAAQLHGDFVVGRWTEEGSAPEVGFPPDVHFAIVAAFYNDVLRRAVTLVSSLVVKTMRSRGIELPRD